MTTSSNDGGMLALLLREQEALEKQKELIDARMAWVRQGIALHGNTELPEKPQSSNGDRPALQEPRPRSSAAERGQRRDTMRSSYRDRIAEYLAVSEGLKAAPEIARALVAQGSETDYLKVKSAVDTALKRMARDGLAQRMVEGPSEGWRLTGAGSDK